MPRKQPSRNNLHVGPAFLKGPCAVTEADVAGPSLTVWASLEQLSHSALALLLDDRELPSQKRPQKLHQAIKSFQALGPWRRMDVLEQLNIFVFPKSGEELWAAHEPGYMLMEWGDDDDPGVPPEVTFPDEPDELSWKFPSFNRKRRRLLSKRAEPDLDRRHLPSGCAVVAGSVIGEEVCRLTREMGKVYAVDFGTRSQKPKFLYPWARSGSEASKRVLILLCVRETGLTYYVSSRDLLASPSFNALLCHSRCLEQAYCRSALFLTPSVFLPQKPGWKVTFLTEEVNESGVDATDGQAEIGLEMARELGLIEENVEGSARVFYGSRQFRAIVQITGTNDICIAKGMLVINPDLEDCELRLRQSCVKLRWEQSAHFETLGVDLARDSSEPMEPAALNAQLSVLLRMRCLALTGEDRVAAMSLLDKLIARSKVKTLAKLSEQAWALNCGSQPDKWDTRRVPAENIKIVVSAEDLVPPDRATVWDQQLEEHTPWKLSRGTRESLLRGSERVSCKYKKLRRKPAALLNKHSSVNYAISDPFGDLKAGECHVICNGCEYVGAIGAWRFPAQLPTDIVVLQAIPLSGRAKYVPDNSIIFSRHGEGACGLAGGDYDGDIVMCSADNALIRLIRMTQTGVDQLELAPLHAQVMEALGTAHSTPFPFPDGYSRLGAFSRFCAATPTPNVRALTSTMAERAQQKAIDYSEVCLEDGSFLLACKCGYVAHAAYDAPKKFCAQAVLTLGASLLTQVGIYPDEVWERSTKMAGDQLRICIPEFNWRKCHESFTEELESYEYPVGAVWAYAPNMYLGHEAGQRVRQILLRHETNVSMHDRSPVRSPIDELAWLIAHRLGGFAKARELVKASVDQVIALALSKSRCRTCESYSALAQTSLK